VECKLVDKEIEELLQKVNRLCGMCTLFFQNAFWSHFLLGVRESDTGLAPPSQWDLAADKLALQDFQPLQVARCTKIINPDTEDTQYIINIKQLAKFVVVCFFFFPKKRIQKKTLYFAF
jgi:26S proteasome regulatory subunit T1